MMEIEPLAEIMIEACCSVGSSGIHRSGDTCLCDARVFLLLEA